MWKYVHTCFFNHVRKPTFQALSEIKRLLFVHFLRYVFISLNYIVIIFLWQLQ